MKIAIVHDYIKEYGGAERVLEALHELYPDAPVYTSVYLPEFLGPHRERFNDWDIRESWARFLPFKDKLISPLRIISPILFRSFDFSEFDVVIVSATGAYSPNMIRTKADNAYSSREASAESRSSNGNSSRQARTIKKSVQVCYCHTPPHYLYGYMTAREWKNNWVMRVMGEIMNHILRLVDFTSAQNVDYFIANSEEVQSRIKKFYRRDSKVIYPPVEISNFKFQISDKYKIPNTKYYLTGGRLARAKGVDIIIEAFKKNGKPLKIFGRGFSGENIKNQILKIKDTDKKSNIEYVGEVTDEEKFTLMANAKAFVFASFDEDFGITPVEAMGMGTPVIAYNSGGVKETVLDGKTGVLYDKNTPDELNKAIKRFEKMTFSSDVGREQAKNFAPKRFKHAIMALVKKVT